MNASTQSGNAYPDFSGSHETNLHHLLRQLRISLQVQQALLTDIFMLVGVVHLSNKIIQNQKLQFGSRGSVPA